MTTSIDVLPDDMLLNIFLVAKEHQFTQHPQIAISQVCKRWRSLALSNPLLWDKLYLENPGTLDSSQICSRTARISSQRSSPLLLDVVIMDDFGAIPYATILESFACRIRNLDMNRMRIQFKELKSLLERIGNVASNLRSMKLPRCENWDLEEDLLTDEALPLPMKLDKLALADSVCLECRPFQLSSITQLQLKEFVITRRVSPLSSATCPCCRLWS